MSLTLYYHPLSSFCHKVLTALYENQVVFDKRLINLGEEADRVELHAIWPIVKFPVIQDHLRSKCLPESSTIIEYVDHFYPGQARLIPADWEEALEVRQWDRFFDNYVQVPMQRIVADRFRSAGGDLTQERALLWTAYRMIEARMATRTWVAGQGFSMADCAAAPALFYALTLVPFPEGATQLHAYFDRLMARPSVQRVISEAKPYFAMYPFEEAIPKRFR